MMLKFFWFGALALAWMPGMTLAHGIDFQTFNTVQHSFVLKPARPEAAAPISDPQTQTPPLAINFQELGGFGSRAPIASTSLQIRRQNAPRWMHSSQRLAIAANQRYFSAGADTFLAADRPKKIPARCSFEAYRPKGLQPKVETRRARYYSLMVETACRVGVPVTLFDALITQESGYNPAAISVKGAMGMAQLMPATARFAGVRNPWDVAENLRGGAQVLKTHLAEFGRYDLALAAYNAGAGRVRRQGRVPHIKETANYVSSILSDVRHQFGQTIGLAGTETAASRPIRNASVLRF